LPVIVLNEEFDTDLMYVFVISSPTVSSEKKVTVAFVTVNEVDVAEDGAVKFEAITLDVIGSVL
jgi:hypothetical protein